LKIPPPARPAAQQYPGLHLSSLTASRKNRLAFSWNAAKVRSCLPDLRWMSWVLLTINSSRASVPPQGDLGSADNGKGGLSVKRFSGDPRI